MTTLATKRTTLNGWQPSIGQLVWQQMYDPRQPRHDATIEERIQLGRPYQERKLMRVHGISHDWGTGRPGITRWYLRHPKARIGSDPAECEGIHPTHVDGPSWVESDWCVLEDASADQGELF